MYSKLLFVFLLFFISCNTSNDFNYNWEQYFSIPENMEFDTSMSDSLFIVASVKSNGDSFVFYDPSRTQFINFDKSLKMKSSFGGVGPGPLEIQTFTATHLSVNGDYYVYDMNSSKIVKYGANITESFEFRLKHQVIDFAVSNSGNILVYHLSSNQNTVLSLFDNEGNLLGDFFTVSDEDYKRFLFRFRNGAVKYDAKNDSFFFLYPDSFDVFEINNEGVVLDTLSFTGKSDFSDYVKPFPANLNPFDMNREHWQYWSSFYHPNTFFLLEDDKILFENVHLSLFENDEVEWGKYFNLYYLTGEPIFEGLKFDSDFIFKNSFNDKSLLVVKQDSVFTISLK